MPPGIRGSLSCSQSNKVSTATLIGSNESVAYWLLIALL